MGKSEWSLTHHEKRPELCLYFKDQSENILSVTPHGLEKDEWAYIAMDQGVAPKHKPVLSREEVRMVRTALTGLGLSNG